MKCPHCGGDIISPPKSIEYPKSELNETLKRILEQKEREYLEAQKQSFLR